VPWNESRWGAGGGGGGGGGGSDGDGGDGYRGECIREGSAALFSRSQLRFISNCTREEEKLPKDN